MMTNMTFRLGAGLAVVFCTLFHDQYVLNKENQNNILYYFILVVLAVFDDLSSF